MLIEHVKVIKVAKLCGLDNTIQAQPVINKWAASRGSKPRQPQYSTLAGYLGEAVGYLIFSWRSDFYLC